jgi:hypothetical protein
MSDKEKERAGFEEREIVGPVGEIVGPVKSVPLSQVVQVRPMVNIESQITTQRMYAIGEDYLDHINTASRHTSAAVSLMWGAGGAAVSALCSWATSAKRAEHPYLLAFGVAFLVVSLFGIVWSVMEGESVPKLIAKFKRNAKPMQ